MGRADDSAAGEGLSTSINADHIPTDGSSDVGKCGPLGQLPCPHLIRDDIKVGSLSPGTHTIYVDAKDMAGNKRTSSFTVIAGGAYPTSVRFGGANRSIDTTAEVDAVRAYIQALAVEAGDNAWWGVSPADQRYIRDHGEATEPQQLCREAFAGDDAGYRGICLHQEEGDGESYRAAGGTSYPELNAEERQFCRAHLHSCALYFQDASEAKYLTELLFTGTWLRSDSTIANAFQHSFWLALMVNSDEAHPDLAWDYGVAHELHEFNLPTSNQKGQRSRMDIINNHVGHKSALNLKTLGQLTDGRACRSILAIGDHVLFVAPPMDPKQEYFARNYAPAYKYLVYRKVKTSGATQVPVVREPTSPDSTCDVADSL
jgi:hypothetical protein